MAKTKSKAQSWSVDVTLGILIFMAAFFIVYGLFSSDETGRNANLKQEAANVIKQISSRDSSLRIVDNNEVNKSKLNQLKDIEYGQLKSMFRVEGDLCIYFEDDKGNIVLMNNSYKGIGAPSINLSGTPCSQK